MPDLRPDAFCPVLFRQASSAPGVRPSDVVSAHDVRRLTDADGIIAATTLSLAAGDYYCWIGASKPRRITVLDLAFPQLLQDLLGGGPGSATQGSNFQVVQNQLQLLSDTGAQIGIVAQGVFPALTLSFVAGSGLINYRHRNGMFELLNIDDQNWYAPVYMGDRATPTLAWLNTGAAPVVNQRFKSGRFQLANLDTQTFYSVLLSGSVGSLSLGFGVPEV